jgi:hypothetical protein
MKELYKENSYIRMPYGKYKGWYIKDIPDDYLRWAVLNISDKATAEMFKTEILRRQPKLRK